MGQGSVWDMGYSGMMANIVIPTYIYTCTCIIYPVIQYIAMSGDTILFFLNVI